MINVVGARGDSSYTLPGEICRICSRERAGKNAHRSKLHRKVVVEPAEVSSTHSTEEAGNDRRGKGWTVISESETFEPHVCSAEIDET